jgi:hypothetical protein
MNAASRFATASSMLFRLVLIFSPTTIIIFLIYNIICDLGGGLPAIPTQVLLSYNYCELASMLLSLIGEAGNRIVGVLYCWQESSVSLEIHAESLEDNA